MPALVNNEYGQHETDARVQTEHAYRAGIVRRGGEPREDYQAQGDTEDAEDALHHGDVQPVVASPADLGQ